MYVCTYLLPQTTVGSVRRACFAQKSRVGALKDLDFEGKKPECFGVWHKPSWTTWREVNPTEKDTIVERQMIN